MGIPIMNDPIMSQDGVYVETTNGIRINVPLYLKRCEEAIRKSIERGRTNENDFTEKMRLEQRTAEIFNRTQEKREKDILEWKKEKRYMQIMYDKMESELQAYQCEDFENGSMFKIENGLRIETPSKYHFEITELKEELDELRETLREITLKILDLT